MENTIKNHTLNSTFNLLKYVFVVVPIVAGADKFTNLTYKLGTVCQSFDC